MGAELDSHSDSDGYGHGYGDGYGSGYGHGYGDGHGDGDGDGDGDGYGYGSADHLLAIYGESPYLDGIQEKITIAFWRSDASGRPCNGGSGEPVSVGLDQRMQGSQTVVLCGRGFHATLDVGMWEGDRVWVVGLIGDVEGNDNKMVASRRIILDEIKPTERG